MKECDSGYKRTICTSMFIAALFTTVKLWKQPGSPVTLKFRIKKMQYVFTMEYYSAVENNEIKLFAGKQLNANELSQAQKVKG
jgi:hypothetical protein